MRKHIKMFRVALMLSAVALASARIYERCELARDLIKLGVNRDHVATWVCIAFHESRFDTAARNPHSGDHGLLQISELYWCGPGKACGVPCSAFRDNDISDDVQCALRIYEEHTRLQGNGFLAWVVYPHHCKHNAKKFLVDCDTTVKTVSKFEDRARHLKSNERNNTTPQFMPQNVAKLKPSYLAINELFKGNYENEFERDYYNNKKPFSWVNFKIDNIDELKLPNVETNQILQFTTPPTTTTTIDPELVGIKPPSPRKIETNQFRRRMLAFEPEKNKDYFNYRASTTTTVQPEIENDFLANNLFINRARALSRFNLNYFDGTTTRSTTTPRTSTTANTRTPKTNYNSFTISPYYNTGRRGKSRYITEINYFSEETKTERPTILISENMKNISRGNKKTQTSEVYREQENSEPTTIKSLSTTISTTAPKFEDTTKISVTSRSITTQTPSRFPLNYNTTPKPNFTWGSAFSSRFSSPNVLSATNNTSGADSIKQTASTTPILSNAASTTATTTTTTERVTSKIPTITTTSAPTTRVTQSIFDLYLNPTKATIKPYNFSSFFNSPSKLRIFSGGTTSLPTSFLRKHP